MNNLVSLWTSMKRKLTLWHVTTNNQVNLLQKETDSLVANNFKQIKCPRQKYLNKV